MSYICKSCGTETPVSVTSAALDHCPKCQGRWFEIKVRVWP